MKTVRFSPSAVKDIHRLRTWLLERAPNVADRAADMIIEAAESLRDFPDRGIPHRGEMRELIVPFGEAAYVVRYRARPDSVLIARIRHSRELG